MNQYTFDSFVVGKPNKFAFIAAKAIVERPTEYNPLFIYGSSGLGKTHLLHAIKNAVCDQYGNESVYLTTAEELSTILVFAIHDKAYDDLELALASTKYLLIDDLHTLVGKKSTQIEFAYIFRSAADRGQQVVATSSLEPSELPFLTDSLRKYCDNGLFADIGLLDYETGKNIIIDKSCRCGIQLSEEEIDEIVMNSNGQAWYIEGAVKKLAAEKSLL